MRGKVARISRGSKKRIARNGPDKALAFLASLAREFTAVLSVSDLVDRILESLHKDVGFDSSAVALLDEQRQDALAIVGASGIRSDFRGSVIPRGQGIHWAVMEGAMPMRVPDMHADTRVFRRFDHARSGIYAPLTVHGRPIGVLSAYRGQVDAFTQGDLDLLTIVARYLAGAFEVARLHEQLRMLAATDALTGLANRRSFLERLESEFTRSRRTGRPLSIALLDLDGFKRINDICGHAAGDTALIRVAEAVGRGIRTYDLAARFGGDEFILLFPETPPAQAEEVLRRLPSIEVSLRDDRERKLLTMSWGIAAWPNDGDSAEMLLRMADARLYAMKRPTSP